MECMDDNQLMTVSLTYSQWINIRAMLNIASQLASFRDAEQLRQAIQDQNTSRLEP
jgi:hypothetical protein